MVSDVSHEEIALAPVRVREWFESLVGFIHLVPVDERVLSLRGTYVAAGIVTEQWAEDAAHVAGATVAGADLVLSWNFRHMVHFERIRA